MLAVLLVVCLVSGYNVQDDPPQTCDIPIIENGVVETDDNSAPVVGEAITVRCGDDYQLSSDVKSVCQEDG